MPKIKQTSFIYENEDQPEEPETALLRLGKNPSPADAASPLSYINDLDNQIRLNSQESPV